MLLFTNVRAKVWKESRYVCDREEQINEKQITNFCNRFYRQICFPFLRENSASRDGGIWSVLYRLSQHLSVHSQWHNCIFCFSRTRSIEIELEVKSTGKWSAREVGRLSGETRIRSVALQFLRPFSLSVFYTWLLSISHPPFCFYHCSDSRHGRSPLRNITVLLNN